MCTALIQLQPCFTLWMIVVSLLNLGLICSTVVIFGICFSMLQLEAENGLLKHLFFFFIGSGCVALLAIRTDNRLKKHGNNRKGEKSIFLTLSHGCKNKSEYG